MNKEKIMFLKKYVVFFYIYAFLGWIIDVSIVFVSDGVLENRGFLYEPICPMYGFAALTNTIDTSIKLFNVDSILVTVIIYTIL